MEFIKGTCPHCNGELQIPQGRESIICMYCGKEITVSDAQAQQVSRPKPVTDDDAVAALQNLLFGIEDPMQYFKKALYMDFYNKYVYKNVSHIHTHCENAPECSYKKESLRGYPNIACQTPSAMHHIHLPDHPF